MRFGFLILFIFLGFLPLTSQAKNSLSIVAPWMQDYTYADLPQNNVNQNQDIHADQSHNQPYYNTPQFIIPAHKHYSGPEKLLKTDKEKDKRPPSILEQIYAERIVDELTQFGYSVFGPQDNAAQTYLAEPMAPMGAVQDDFLLGHGDEIEIVLSGQRSERATYNVNSEGLLLIRDFPPIPAAGRTLGQVRSTIEAAAHNLYNTQAFVSLARVRQIHVLVVGHVQKPGRKTLNIFHTPLDALMLAGGIEKTGSLRQIKLARHGRSMIIDLYALLMNGAAMADMQLQDGDRIIVPALGPTVAVAGEAKRPAIYEILPALHGMHHKPGVRSENLSLNDMLNLGGGVLSPGKNRFLKLTMTDEGAEKVSEIHEPFAPLFGDGSVLMISKGKAKREGLVEIDGHTRRPGLYALSENNSLQKLIGTDDVLGPDIYPLIGVIERWDSGQLARKLIEFPLRLVLNKNFDRKLLDGDIVHLFSTAQINALSLPVVIPPNMDEGSRPDADHVELIQIQDPTMVSFLKERAAFVRGAVRKPGPYPVAEGATLDTLLAVAGGLTLEANSTNIELTSALQGKGHQTHGRSGTRRTKLNFREDNPTLVSIAPGDAVRVNQRFRKVKNESTLIIGAVKNPGRYDLLPGDKVSDLLARAGGLTKQAYPDGAIFSRAAERKAEEARFRAQARDMRRAISAAVEEENDQKIAAAKISEARALAKELENAQGIGRITAEADPAVLKVQPELDMLLEAGDRIYIPQRSLTVRVSGEVLSPAALQFKEAKKPIDYIHEAGGFTFHADKDRAFVLYPDGSAQPLQVSSWSYKPVFIPPGSTIIVPADPEPFNFIKSAKDISQILSNLAITAIFVDDVRED